jgi:hypothetical protein
VTALTADLGLTAARVLAGLATVFVPRTATAGDVRALLVIRFLHSAPPQRHSRRDSLVAETGPEVSLRRVIPVGRKVSGSKHAALFIVETGPRNFSSI